MGSEIGWPVPVSQTLVMPASVEVARALPSGLKLAQKTGPSWPKGGSAGFPVLASQSRTVLSEEAESNQRSSGLNAATQQIASCRIGPRRRAPSGTDQM